MGYLSNFSDEELSLELSSRRNDKIVRFKTDNLLRNRSLSMDVVDFIAPFHSKTNLSDCNKLEELLASGYSRCNRCSLEAMRKQPDRFSDIRIDVTVDFTTSKQTSFK